MKETINILKEIEEGKLSVDEAVKQIKSITNLELKYKAKKIKIKIHDKENNKRINLPALHLGILGIFASIIYKISIKHYKGKEKGQKVDANEIKELFLLLRQLPPFKLVEIDDEEARVEIYTK